jgi:sodium/potassium-transporting ATPase subunit alpha
MGLCGSEVAREAANLIIMDDSFASIVTGIEIGRVIWDNLKKTIAYTLSHLFPEILPILLLLAFGLPPGLSSLQILTIDLLTEMPPAISLSHEGSENDVMKRLPRNVKEDHLVTAPLVMYSYMEIGVIESVACVVSYIVAFATFGISMTDLAFTDDLYFEEDSPNLCTDGESAGDGCYDADEQISILRQVTATWYMTLILSQAFHIWMCKTRRVSFFKHPLLENKAMIVGVVIELLLMIIFVFVPGLNTEVLSTDIPFWWSWMPGVICGLFICLFNELRKKAMRRRPHWTLSRILAW